MSNEEITEVTKIEGKEKKIPSFWANFLALLMLAGSIFVAQRISNFLNKKMIPKQIVERQAAVQIIEPTIEPSQEIPPQPEPLAEAKPKQEIAETDLNKEVLPTTEPSPSTETKTEIKPVKEETPAPKKKSVSRKPVPPKPIPQVAQPDPYTDGSELDLDRPEIQEQYKQGNVIRVPAEATATPVPANETERDQFIPFENQE